MKMWLFLVTVLCGWRPSLGVFDTKDLPLTAYKVKGDINLGVLLTVKEFSKTKPCGDHISTVRFMLVESIAFAVNRINQNPDILPNHTLGFTMLDDCNKAATSLVQASKFVPLSSCLRDECHGSEMGQSHYDVIGVVGPTTSSKSALVSPLLGQHRIPHVSFATSAAFSNKNDYKYFSRIVPPDQYQAKAIMDLIGNYNWTYISLVYMEGPYGQTLKKQIQIAAKKMEICIAYTQEVDQGSSDEDFDVITRNLLKHEKAKVVVLILNYYRQFLASVDKLNAVGKFIFIGSETFDLSAMKGLEHVARGSFSFMIPAGRSMEFEKFYLNRKPETSDNNPWIHTFWQEIFDCSWEENITSMMTTHHSCSQHHSVTEYSGYFLRGDVAIFMDGVLVFAKAIHNIFTGTCGFNKIASVSDLVTHPDVLLSCIRNLSFIGESGPVLFDERGDLIGRYLVKHVVASGGGLEQITIGEWVRNTGFLNFSNTKVQWSPKHLNESGNFSEIPESVCAKPCKAGEFYIQGELTCCWECRRCRNNEFVRADGKGCDICPVNTWPNQTDFMSCLDIPPSYLTFSDNYGLTLILVAVTGVLCTAAAIAFFVRKRNHKAIKGSQIELMIFIFIGIISGYVGSFLFAVKPDDDMCICTYVIYNISLVLLFAPLVVKTLRIYRIFLAAEKCRQHISCVGPASVTIQTSVLILTQIGLLILTLILYTPKSKLQMPVLTEPYSELLCDISLHALLTPFSYILLLILFCCVCGFLTRTLPDNYNESWYIFLSVFLTLLAWIAFLPTYFYAFYASHRAALLALALFLNASAVLLFLVVPKIYAVLCIEENLIKTSSFRFDAVGSSSGSAVGSISASASMKRTSSRM